MMTKAFLTYAGRQEGGKEWMKKYLDLLRAFMAEQEKMLKGGL